MEKPKTITINIGVIAKGRMVDVHRQATMPYNPIILTVIENMVGHMADAAEKVLVGTGCCYGWEPANKESWNILFP